jgi:hypothetical protein
MYRKTTSNTKTKNKGKEQRQTEIQRRNVFEGKVFEGMRGSSVSSFSSLEATDGGEIHEKRKRRHFRGAVSAPLKQHE